MSLVVYRLVDPAFWGVILVGVALWRLRRACGEKKWTWRVGAFAYVCLALYLTPAVGRLNLWLLERLNLPVNERPEVEAIVVLGGGSFPQLAGSPASRLSDATARRCLRAAELYRQGPPLPVIASGGSVRPNEIDFPECAAMRDLLIELGVRREDILLDDRSRNTWENAVESHRLLAERNVRRSALVTDAVHLPRATRCFRRQGAEIVPVGCGYIAIHRRPTWLDFLPASEAAEFNASALHEWLGMAYYAVRGR